MQMNEPYQVFGARCAQLGVPCWRLELAGGRLIEPDEPAAMLPLLRAPSVRAAVLSAMTAMAQIERPETSAIFPGWTLLYMHDGEPARRHALTAALLLNDTACSTA